MLLATMCMRGGSLVELNAYRASHHPEVENLPQNIYTCVPTVEIENQ